MLKVSPALSLLGAGLLAGFFAAIVLQKYRAGTGEDGSGAVTRSEEPGTAKTDALPTHSVEERDGTTQRERQSDAPSSEIQESLRKLLDPDHKVRQEALRNLILSRAVDPAILGRLRELWELCRTDSHKIDLDLVFQLASLQESPARETFVARILQDAWDGAKDDGYLFTGLRSVPKYFTPLGENSPITRQLFQVFDSRGGSWRIRYGPIAGAAIVRASSKEDRLRFRDAVLAAPDHFADAYASALLVYDSDCFDRLGALTPFEKQRLVMSLAVATPGIPHEDIAAALTSHRSIFVNALKEASLTKQPETETRVYLLATEYRKELEEEPGFSEWLSDLEQTITNR